MKLHPTIFLLLSMCLVPKGHSQEVALTNGTAIDVLTNTLFFVNGLAFNSTVDFQIAAPNSIERASTPINAQSINRVVNLDNTIFNYQGNLTLHYEDSELNGIDENDLILNVEDELNNRATYTGTIDTFLNTLSYDFASPINILSVTASDASTLSVDHLNAIGIRFYPNPTATTLNIVGADDLETNVYDLNGKRVLQSNENSIDISHLMPGVYLFKVRTVSERRVNVFKILKN